MKIKFVVILFLLITLLVVAVLSFVKAGYVEFFQHFFKTEEITFDVPETDFKLRHARIGLHPYLAEYDRWISVIAEDGNETKFRMAVDTCGGYPIRCYLIRSKDRLFVRLKDSVSEHIIDLSNSYIYTVFQFSDGIYLIYDHKKQDISENYIFDASKPNVTFGDCLAFPIKSIIPEYEQLYFGYLDGKVGGLRFFGNQEP